MRGAVNQRRKKGTGCYTPRTPPDLPRRPTPNMKLSLDNQTTGHVIRAYDRGEVVINDLRITQSVVVLPEQLIRDWPPQSFEDLTLEHLQTLADLDVEIILLGTGDKLRFPAAPLLQALAGTRIGLEVMDTAAACRTYNVLSAEGRKVAAALMMI